jgi:hypothetical protein
MALFGRDYDRDYGYYGNPRGGYDNGYRGGMMYNDMEDRGYRGGMYTSYDRGAGYYGSTGYDRGDYKSRWQTDYGDPFGDRSAHTPMRVIRGGYHGGNMGYDRDYGYMGGTRYDREYNFGGERDYYGGNPSTYDPYMNRSYEGRQGTWNRYDANFNGGYRNSGYGRGYDRNWF